MNSEHKLANVAAHHCDWMAAFDCCDFLECLPTATNNGEGSENCLFISLHTSR